MADTAEYILPDCGKEKFFPPYFPVVFLAMRSIPTVPEVLSSDRISEFLKIHSSKSTWFIYFNWELDDMLLTLLSAFLSLLFIHSLNLWAFTEKAMALHSSTLAWEIPWTEEPGRLWSMGSLRVRHDRATLLSLFTFMHWRRKWQPTPVFLPGESQGRGSLVGCRLWGCTELDTTEVT